MDPRSILDTGTGQDPISAETLPQGSPQREWPGTRQTDEQAPTGDARFPGEDGGKSLAEMAQRDLVATLQLLAERAQYITASTGSAIALRDDGQMVCRASAGTSAPEVGVQLQVDSGLSGESVRTKQTLRCDDAATDTRVNRESCEALGIASVVVMPLVRGDEVIGVFELFSDKANVYEVRDITALERMGGMVFTALEHALAAQGLSPEGGPAAQRPPTAAVEFDGAGPEPGSAASESHPVANVAAADKGITFHVRAPIVTPASAAAPENQPESKAQESEDVLEVATEFEISSAAASKIVAGEEAVLVASRKLDQAERMGPEDQVLLATRSLVANLRRCESCGFPVSEGRQLCLDCERERAREGAATRNASGTGPAASAGVAGTSRSPVAAAPVRQEVPLFLRKDREEASWLSSHKFMLGAIAVAVAGIVALLFVR